MTRAEIERHFPKLRQSNWKKTSQATARYNCIAWAASNPTSWWEPSGRNEHHWPNSVLKEYTEQSYIQAFAAEGYSICDNADLESGFQKIALYVNPMGMPSHAARQKLSGTWTSKLGESIDIEHDSLTALEGNIYGQVKYFLKRPYTGQRYD